ncbi:hypothetical protein BSKO_09885 [Bryopsis sp. KO-2023]|nr:hypothetical protein BSKO_09885 [Bryopsis sp. KO-2023]
MTAQKAVSEGAAGDGGAKRLWGGRFTGATDPLMEKFNESLSFDQRMWAEDIRGSQSYAKALEKVGILSGEETKQIIDGLDKVGEEWENGSFEVKSGDEDIHTANERRLTEIVGSVGGKLHTGRSRNDQVATDTRLWLMKEVKLMRSHLHALMKVACERSEREVDVLMPGFTHLQSAQTVRWGHWIMSHVAAWQRDDQRFNDMTPRIATLPLGSGALAGNPFLVDRQFLSEDLGFSGGVTLNSMDAVSDRDFVAEFIFTSSLLMVHLSRWAEDLIVYSSSPFGFVKCSDAYTTGSSLMPQKKNPDALELIRGKAGRIQGNLSGLLCVLKGTPTTYNKDFQEAWQLMFDTVDSVNDCLQIGTGVLSTIEIFPENMMKGLSSEMLATDLAEYLVRKGVPFRDTHHISGEVVRMAESKKCALSDLSLEELKTASHFFMEDVSSVWEFQKSAEGRDTEGGASRRSVLEQAQKIRKYLDDQ